MGRLGNHNRGELGSIAFLTLLSSYRGRQIYGKKHTEHAGALNASPGLRRDAGQWPDSGGKKTSFASDIAGFMQFRGYRRR